MNQKPKKLLDQMRDVIRVKHYSTKTERVYVHWIRSYILFHKKRHPRDMGAPEIEAFLTYLAVDQKVAASTQNQALSAILFLYREVLRFDITETLNIVWAKRSSHVPTVLSKDEVARVIGLMSGTQQIMAKLMYGSGMRLNECIQLRVKDLDFEYKQINIHNGYNKWRLRIIGLSENTPQKGEKEENTDQKAGIQVQTRKNQLPRVTSWIVNPQIASLSTLDRLDQGANFCQVGTGISGSLSTSSTVQSLLVRLAA